MHISAIILALAASANLVAAHGAIVKAVGDAGGQGMALGSKFSPSSLIIRISNHFNQH